MTEGTGGRDSDGSGTTGMVDEKSRPAQAGETGTTRFGQAGGEDSDGEGTGGMVRGEDAGGAMPGSSSNRNAPTGQPADKANGEDVK